MLDDGLTTIENVVEAMDKIYDNSPLMKKIRLKAWKAHSSSRVQNGDHPFTFENYNNHMRYSDYVDQVHLGIIDCTDLGGKEKVMNYLINGVSE